MVTIVQLAAVAAILAGLLLLTSASDCEVTEWNAWSKCIGTCLLSMRARNRDVSKPPFPEVHDGKLAMDQCPPLYQVQQCVIPSCPEDIARFSASGYTEVTPPSKVVNDGHITDKLQINHELPEASINKKNVAFVPSVAPPTDGHSITETEPLTTSTTLTPASTTIPVTIAKFLDEQLRRTDVQSLLLSHSTFQSPFQAPIDFEESIFPTPFITNISLIETVPPAVVHSEENPQFPEPLNFPLINPTLQPSEPLPSITLTEPPLIQLPTAPKFPVQKPIPIEVLSPTLALPKVSLAEPALPTAPNFVINRNSFPPAAPPPKPISLPAPPSFLLQKQIPLDTFPTSPPLLPQLKIIAPSEPLPSNLPLPEIPKNPFLESSVPLVSQNNNISIPIDTVPTSPPRLPQLAVVAQPQSSPNKVIWSESFEKPVEGGSLSVGSNIIPTTSSEFILEFSNVILPRPGNFRLFAGLPTPVPAKNQSTFAHLTVDELNLPVPKPFPVVNSEPNIDNNPLQIPESGQLITRDNPTISQGEIEVSSGDDGASDYQEVIVRPNSEPISLAQNFTSLKPDVTSYKNTDQSIETSVAWNFNNTTTDEVKTSFNSLDSNVTGDNFKIYTRPNGFFNVSHSTTSHSTEANVFPVEEIITENSPKTLIENDNKITSVLLLSSTSLPFNESDNAIPYTKFSSTVDNTSSNVKENKENVTEYFTTENNNVFRRGLNSLFGNVTSEPILETSATNVHSSILEEEKLLTSKQHFPAQTVNLPVIRNIEEQSIKLPSMFHSTRGVVFQTQASTKLGSVLINTSPSTIDVTDLAQESTESQSLSQSLTLKFTNTVNLFADRSTQLEEFNQTTHSQKSTILPDEISSTQRTRSDTHSISTTKISVPRESTGLTHISTLNKELLPAVTQLINSTEQPLSSTTSENSTSYQPTLTISTSSQQPVFSAKINISAVTLNSPSPPGVTPPALTAKVTVPINELLLLSENITPLPTQHPVINLSNAASFKENTIKSETQPSEHVTGFQLTTDALSSASTVIAPTKLNATQDNSKLTSSTLSISNNNLSPVAFSVFIRTTSTRRSPAPNVPTFSNQPGSSKVPVVDLTTTPGTTRTVSFHRSTPSESTNPTPLSSIIYPSLSTSSFAINIAYGNTASVFPEVNKSSSNFMTADHSTFTINQNFVTSLPNIVKPEVTYNTTSDGILFGKKVAEHTTLKSSNDEAESILEKFSLNVNESNGRVLFFNNSTRLTQSPLSTTTDGPHNPCAAAYGNKRCCRAQFRVKCPDGKQSQMVMRWHRIAGQTECSAYNYGYCGLDLEIEDQPIKFEQECYSICYSDVEKQNSPLFKDIHFEDGFRINRRKIIINP